MTDYQKMAKEIRRLHSVYRELSRECDALQQRLENGRHYLMSTTPKDLSIEDALESFGWTRDGLSPDKT